jgi:Arc/MetJ-type ribon-helix-helix transcriptional regulator
MKANNSDGERITLRLEQDDVVLIDNYIDIHPEYSSRSHLARMAIRSLVKRDAQPEKAEPADEEPESSPQPNMITIEIPMAIFNIMEDSKRRGEYSSYQTMIEELVRAKFLVKEATDRLNAEVQIRSAMAVAKNIEIM